MLDHVNTFELCLVIVALMALLIEGASHVRSLGVWRRYTRPRWSNRVLNEAARFSCAEEPARPRVSPTPAHQARAQTIYPRSSVARVVRRKGHQIDPDSCYSTTTLSLPKDAA